MTITLCTAPPCTVCPGCKLGTITTIRGHNFAREVHTPPRWPDIRQWRWVCSCGRKGRWQLQSPSVSYHAWRKHVLGRSG